MFPSTPILLANGRLSDFSIWVADPDGEITKKPGMLRISGLPNKLNRNYTAFSVVDDGGLKKVTFNFPGHKQIGDIPVGGGKLERITGDVILPPNGDGGPGGNDGFEPPSSDDWNKDAGMSESTVVIIGAVLFALVGYLIWRRMNKK